MADSKDTDGSAEQAYAGAASELKADKAEAGKAADTSPAPEAPAKPVEAEKTPASKPAAAKPVARKKAPATQVAKAKPARAKPPAKAKPAPAKTPAVAKKAPPKLALDPAPATPSVTELKEKIMATKNTDFTAAMSKSMSDAVSDMQSKAQAAYDKTTTMVSEMTEVAKGNVEALVESGKIMAAGMQDMGKTYADEAKSAYETMTADMKEMAAVKSPTELFQLQGKIMRRNFDAMVATSSKNTEAAMKLANDVFAPISGRVNLTVEKLSKVA